MPIYIDVIKIIKKITYKQVLIKKNSVLASLAIANFEYIVLDKTTLFKIG